MKPTRLFACGVVFFACTTAYAQSDYPNRPIRVIVPYPPGGGVDLLAWILSDKLPPRRGQPIIVANRSGSGGNVGSEAAFRAAPDASPGARRPLRKSPSRAAALTHRADGRKRAPSEFLRRAGGWPGLRNQPDQRLMSSQKLVLKEADRKAILRG